LRGRPSGGGLDRNAARGVNHRQADPQRVFADVQPGTITKKRIHNWKGKKVEHKPDPTTFPALVHRFGPPMRADYGVKPRLWVLSELVEK